MNQSEYDRYRYDEYSVQGRISAAQEHLVEDARTRRGLEEQNKPRRARKRKVRSEKSRTLLTVLITLLAFSLSLVAADLLSGRSTLTDYVAVFSRKNKEDVAFYAVYAMKTEDMALAYKNASAVRAEGGAGYVLKDQSVFYVVLNVYADEKDAKSVAEKEVNYSIYEICFPQIDAQSEALSFLMPTKDLYFESYLALYQAANDLASGKYAEEDMKRSLEKQREKIAAAQDSYSESIRGKEDTVRIEYKVLLAEIKSAFDNLLSADKALVADARYYSVMIVHSYALFAQKYSS